MKRESSEPEFPTSRYLGGWSEPGAPDSPLPYGGVQIRYFQLAWRHKWLILLCTIAGAALGTGWVIYQEPVYGASTTLEIVGLNESFMGLDQVDPQAGTGSYSATAMNIQTQTRIITSGALLGSVVERLNLEMTPIAPSPQGVIGKLRNRLNLLPSEPVEQMREAIATAVNSVSARSIGTSRLIQISTESTSPEIAASFANTLAAEYGRQNMLARSQSAQKTLQWIEGQLADTKSRLDQAEGKLHDYVARSGIDFVAQSGTLDVRKLEQLQQSLSVIQEERIAKESRWEIARSSPIDSLPEILDDGTLRSLKGQLAQLNQQRATLTATLMPEHYKVQRLDAQIQELEQTLRKEKTDLVRRIQNEYEASLRRERMLSDEYRKQSQKIVSKSDQAAEYAALVREVETTRQFWDVLLKQLNQAMMVFAVPTDNVRIVDPARPAVMPSRPRPLRDISMGAGLGGGLVYGLLFLFEYRRLKKLQQVFAAPGYVGAFLRTPELGVIPTIEARRPQSRWLAANGKARKAAGLLTAGDGDMEVQREGGPELVTWRQKPSLQAESFRFALTSILGSKDPDWKPVLTVTSPGPGEGKSTVVSNLGIATAETGRRVILIDADWRKARLHTAFGVALEPGLANLIAGDEAMPESMADFIRPTGIPGLSLLPAGVVRTGHLGPFQVASRMAALLERVKEQFDVILIDTAPALHFADARLIGRLSDGLVLVVRSGETFRKSALRVREQFAEDGVPILGTILNDWKPDSTGDYYTKQYKVYQHAYESRPPDE